MCIRDSTYTVEIAYVGYATKQIQEVHITAGKETSLSAVSYTHLDVYKRQPLDESDNPLDPKEALEGSTGAIGDSTGRTQVDVYKRQLLHCSLVISPCIVTCWLVRV